MDNNTFDLIQLASSISAIIVALIALLKSYLIPKHERRKYNTEADKADAEASKTFEEAAHMASERANQLEIRLAKLEADFRTEIDRLNGEIKERDKQIEQLMRELETKEEVIAQLKDWSERLVHQIQSLGQTPVPFENPPPKLPKSRRR